MADVSSPLPGWLVGENIQFSTGEHSTSKVLVLVSSQIEGKTSYPHLHHILNLKRMALALNSSDTCQRHIQVDQLNHELHSDN